MKQFLYASHWLGHDDADDECRPDLYLATLMPFGQSVRCAKTGCDGEWVLAQTEDATSALVRPGAGTTERGPEDG